MVASKLFILIAEKRIRHRLCLCKDSVSVVGNDNIYDMSFCVFVIPHVLTESIRLEQASKFGSVSIAGVIDVEVDIACGDSLLTSGGQVV